MSGERLQVKTLGGWKVTYDGKPALRGKNSKIVLHALILGGGSVFREELAELIGEHVRVSASGRYGGVKNILTRLRDHSLDIPPGEDPVILPKTQPNASIDLWDFFAHVECGRYSKAYELIADGQEPHLFAGADDPEHPVWRETIEEFKEARAQTLAARDAALGRRRSMLATRESLLARTLVPGIGPSLPIECARKRLGKLKLPWIQEHPERLPSESHLPVYLADLLRTERPNPTQVVVVGPPGSGKTLAAISTYLHLTDELATDPTASSVRTVLYVDPESEGSQRGFGSARWLEKRLRQVGAEGSGRPVIVMPHGDALFSQRSTLRGLLASRLFRDHDLLICGSAQMYAQRLRYEGYGTHILRLEPWSPGLQKAFARRLAGGQKSRQFEQWLKQDLARRQLCAVPLHLVYVLSMLGEDADVLAEISTPAQLFEGVARMRLRVAATGFDEAEMMRELAGIAHRFYADATPADTPIRFPTEELEPYLRSRRRREPKRRAEALINRTLLTVPRSGGSVLRFEEPSWGWFFVARHLTHSVVHSPETVCRDFSKLLSAQVRTLCLEMLTEKLEYYRSEIQESLGAALGRRRAKGVAPERLEIARAQVGYLLAAVGDRRVREELTALVEPGSAGRDPSEIVRRGLLLGLADAGSARHADLYVELLAAEREAGGPSWERDTNIGFMLNSRGDQRFDPERPNRIGKGVNPVRTVDDLVATLEDPDRKGSRRVKLFTLIDLGRHPAIPERHYRRALERRDEDLRRILARLRQDPDARGWPELDELEDLLED